MFLSYTKEIAKEIYCVFGFPNGLAALYSKLQKFQHYVCYWEWNDATLAEKNYTNNFQKSTRSLGELFLWDRPLSEEVLLLQRRLIAGRLLVMTRATVRFLQKVIINRISRNTWNSGPIKRRVRGTAYVMFGADRLDV